MRATTFLCAVLLASSVDGKRWGGSGFGKSSRRGGSTSTYKHRTPPPPPPPPKVDTGNSNHFLNSERGASSSSGTTHNRGNPFDLQSARPPQTSGPLGFERVGGGTNQQGNKNIGFDKVNSEVQHKPAGSYNPSAPPYPGGGSHVPSAPQYPVNRPPNGHPPAYNQGAFSGTSYSGANDHPPSYPGRPVNAPPSYSAGNPQYGNSNPSQPGYGSNFPGQYSSYQGQTYPGHPNYGNTNFGNNHGSYPQQNQFGNVGQGSYGSFPYSGNTGFYPGNSGGSFSGNSQFGNAYQGNSYGGSPFGGGFTGNPSYSPNNFGYSSNPGYFGSHGSYPGQYDSYQKRSRFGGLPIPIPIPIPLGGFGFGSGLGGFGGSSYNHRLLDSFIKSNGTVPTSNSSTSVFVLNNSTVAPCTTDHFLYGLLKVSVISCTAEFCTAIKMLTTTSVSNVVSVHSASITMCLENNATVSHHGDNVTPTVSEIQQESLTVCRDISNNITEKAANATAKKEETSMPGVNSSSTESTTTDVTSKTDATSTVETITKSPDLLNSTFSNSSRVCEGVNCSFVEMCLPTIEIVDQCDKEDCPFRRTGYKACIKIKMCRSPSTPISTFASLNTTISKIDEYNHQNSVYDAANLTLISYHRPVISFNCSRNATAPGCPPATLSVPQAICNPTNSTQTVTDGTSTSSGNSTLCNSNNTATPNATQAVPATSPASSSSPS